MWIVSGKVWQPKDTAVPGHGQVVGHVGLPKPPGYKSASVTEVGVEGEAGWREVLLHAHNPPARYFGLELVHPKTSELLRFDILIMW